MPEHPTILVAANDPALRGLLESVLKNVGYATLSVGDGDTALDAIRAGGIDGVVVDMTLGEAFVFEICRLLRTEKSSPYIPIFLISPAVTRDDDVVSVLAAGADDCLTNPFRPGELTLKLKNLMERRRSAVLRRQMLENLLWLAKGTEALLSSGEHHAADPSVVDDGPSGTEAALSEVLSSSGFFRAKEIETDWDDVEQAMQQALRYFQDETHGEDEELIKSVMARLSTAVAQAGLYRQARDYAERLQDANEKLRELDRLRNEFTNAVVHDIRSPLGSVISTLELIDLELQERRPDFHELRTLTEGARQVAEKIIGLINELLDYSKYESGVMQLNFVLISPADLLTEVAEEWTVQARRKQITVSYGCDEGLPKILVDLGKLRRALMNLLSNAVKFTPEGGQIWIEAREIQGRDLEAGRRYVMFNVIDSGEGISPQDTPYVFDPYYQARSRTGHLGTGLGLAIVKRFAAAHGGNVSVKSQLGIGTAFSIMIPLHYEPKAPPADSDDREAEAPEPVSGETSAPPPS